MKMGRRRFLSILVLFTAQDYQCPLSPQSFQIFGLAQKFEPYALNGGLVSAVAGRDYVLIASDTRLTDSSGYEILSRSHLSSRIWDCGNQAASTLTLKKQGVINQDGSLVFPSRDTFDLGDKDCTHVNVPKAPTFISSAGCASDCEALKRQIRSELEAHDWNAGETTLHCSAIANMLGQTLYTRRGFPFYSFCLVAGMEHIEGEPSQGLVHVYDAIGSFERVAVASAGSGKEMMQPILDRLFSSKTATQGANEADPIVVRDKNAIEASQQRVGLKLSPPVKTFVDCTAQDAIGFLVKGYRAVAEREITVGDYVVLLLVQKCRDDGYDVKVMKFQLKKH